MRYEFRTARDIPPQTGKIAVVTGANRGLGYETSIALAAAGATVILAGRNEATVNEAIVKILSLHPKAKLEFGKLDLASLTSISEFATTLATKHDHLDMLINNAGVLTSKRETTQDGFEMCFGTNHLGHFALTAQLIPLLRKNAKRARVINVSSFAHRQGIINFDDLHSEKCRFGCMSIYGQSKAANILFTLELQRRSDEEGWGLLCAAAHPGFSRTDSNTNLPGFTGWFSSTILRSLFSQTAKQGALPILYAATSPDAQKSAYYGPDGFYEMSGNVAPAFISPAARDMATAKKLWNVSVEMTKVAWSSS